ncbi:MAG: hypothetical protein PHD46_02200 [Eubacteriales bacterium]|nr:hypothetical protein [Eubacteriales bacterium]MDD4421827.1 hypothetical protein [Eubacteriales bacterium]
MEQKKVKLLGIIAVISWVTTVLINIAAYFMLPDTIITQINFSSEKSYMQTLTYLIIVTVLVLISACMTIFTGRKTKWVTLTLILFSINVICILLNLL